MHFNFKPWLILILFILIRPGFAQILDDTTRVIYGPTTTLFTSEKDILLSRNFWQTVDTTINDFHRFSLTDQSKYMVQDLGVIGSPVRRVFYTFPESIGMRPGFTALSPYFKGSSEFRYYDTRSPHIDLDVILGGEGRSITDVLFTQNIGPQFNFGAQFRKLSIDKQIGVTARGDRRVLSTSYNLFGNFRTKNKKYHILFHFSRTRHKYFESGGIQTNQFTRLRNLYEDTVRTVLNDGENVELRRNYHYYHQFMPVKFAGIYHVFDLYRQNNMFNFFNLAFAPSGYFSEFRVDSSFTSDQSSFKYYKNELGLKGRVDNIYYNFYYKRRDLTFRYKYADSLNLFNPIKTTEHYLGYRIGFDKDSALALYSEGELLDNGNFKIKASARYRFLWGQINQMKYRPAMIENAYFGNHDRWINDFQNQSVTQVKGGFHFKNSWLAVKPSISFSTLSDYVYYGPDTTSTQLTGDVNIISPKVQVGLKFLKYMHFEGMVVYTDLDDDRAIRIPELFINTKLYFKKVVFKGALDMELGIDTHFHSSYFGYNYYPVLMQFFVQDDLKIPSVFSADLFFNARLNRGRIFLKLVNLKQMFTLEGYLVAPYYIGQPNVIDFGFNWQFYD